MRGHVFGRQGQHSPLPEALHFQVATLVTQDRPKITVRNEILALVGTQLPIVLPRHDHIVHAGLVPIVQQRPGLADGAVAGQ
ncbi:hypothetical protein [Cryobacterium sp. Y11]|uniref:hypothetical protein n=1 Tax=Cryobacterium sp. Y11 TaxID=2045016 RepID=UPI000CE55A2D|nr:hypothetical protein [Cryobacterium sp. Y11]